jgi:hypothetical protein
MTLLSLGEYLILLVCLELPLVDITSLRQVAHIASLFIIFLFTFPRYAVFCVRQREPKSSGLIY